MALAAAALLPALQASGQTLSNLAIVTTEEGSFSFSEDDRRIRFRADLELTTTAFPNPVIGGNRVTLGFDVENLGPANSTGFDLVVVLPEELSLESPPANCALQAPGAVCGFTDLLGPGSLAEFSLVLSFEEDFTEPLEVITRVRGTEVDVDFDNSRSVVSLTIERPFFFGGFEDGTTGEWSSLFP
ncbi:MAG: hypothetical protein AAF725_15350 [Acidobacteriota bacterium]